MKRAASGKALPSTTDSEMRLLVPAITDLLVWIVQISFLKFSQANIGTALANFQV